MFLCVLCSMASEMFLYWASGSPMCWRVMLVLEEKGLSDYSSKLLSFAKEEEKSEEVLKWNPRGQVYTARSELRKVLFWRCLLLFCLCMKCLGEPLNGFAPHSQGRSLAHTSLNVKGQRSKVMLTRGKNGIFRPFGGLHACGLFGKTSLTSSFWLCMKYLGNH